MGMRSGGGNRISGSIAAGQKSLFLYGNSLFGENFSLFHCLGNSSKSAGIIKGLRGLPGPELDESGSISLYFPWTTGIAAQTRPACPLNGCDYRAIGRTLPVPESDIIDNVDVEVSVVRAWTSLRSGQLWRQRR